MDSPAVGAHRASVPAASSGTSTATNGCTGHALPMTAPTRTSPPGVLLINAPAPTSSHGTTR